MSKPDDIDQDAWDRSEQFWRMPGSERAAVARAIMAERERIAAALDEEADVTPCEQDAIVVQDCANLVRANFSYDEAEQVAAIKAAAIRKGASA